MARTQEQNDAMKQERRANILSAALKLFASRGLAATKISDIATVTGMSQGLVYHYFPSKEHIFTEIIASAFARMNSACEMLLSDPAPPHEKITKAMEVLIAGIRDHEDTARYHLLIATATASDAIPAETKEIITKHNRYPYKVMETIIRQGQKEGTIRDHNPKELATLFWTTVLGLAIHKSSHGANARMPHVSLCTLPFLTEKKV